MAQHELIKLFETNQVRIFFDDELEQWFFCINDVIAILTGSKDPVDYFKKLRKRDSELDAFVRGTNCPPHQFVSSDGKRHNPKCASLPDMLRIIQSIPSKQAEPLKRWLAQVIEWRLGHTVISSHRAIDYIQPKEELPFPKENDNK